MASSSLICAAAKLSSRERAGGSRPSKITKTRETPTSSVRWIAIARCGLPASIAARARRMASGPSGWVTAKGGSYNTIPANRFGAARAASRVTIAPDE